MAKAENPLANATDRVRMATHTGAIMQQWEKPFKTARQSFAVAWDGVQPKRSRLSTLNR
ncbi:MAG TPA: hypothetical protein PK967_19270 [Candidatus Hydrogenedentes bacterium]|nr:hypothetical protein [Candidatus Hydrogenedentota bacterium]